jgi:hypothetical protein
MKGLTFLFCISSADELIKDVEDSLIFGLSNHSSFLQQVRL